MDFQHILNFVKDSTLHFDESHNHIHAMKVNENSHKIMKSLNMDYDETFLTYAAMLHDVRDHKYPESISETDLENFIETNLEIDKKNMIMKIINNVSYSKEAKGQREILEHPYNIYLDVISDADRLEALGKIGIERCEQFVLSHGGKVPCDVVAHCHEKLLRLLPDGFIKTDLGKELAKPLHNEILEYVLQNATLNS